MEKGNSTAEGLVILVILIVIMLVTLKGGPNPTTNSPDTSNLSRDANSDNEKVIATDSSYVKNISLGAGNAKYAYQPYEEYVTIYNRGKESVNITGWQLKNSKDKRAYDLGGGLRYFPADIAIINRGTLFISPNGINKLQDILLQPGETAIITTGSIGLQLPYKIVSFKENICSGYLEDLPEYAFTPALSSNCPRPAEEPGVNNLDTECRKFIERTSPCRTPKFDTINKDGDICHNCVDDKLLSSSCVAFMKNHFNYSSCIANHAGDKNFSGRTWRIFLGQGWEMWANKYETIFLLDQFGRLVAERIY